MKSVYQLLSLLFVFGSLRVDELDACSCALTHPQDAFCNSDIGKKRFSFAFTLTLVISLFLKLQKHVELNNGLHV